MASIVVGSVGPAVPFEVYLLRSNSGRSEFAPGVLMQDGSLTTMGSASLAASETLGLSCGESGATFADCLGSSRSYLLWLRLFHISVNSFALSGLLSTGVGVLIYLEDTGVTSLC